MLNVRANVAQLINLNEAVKIQKIKQKIICSFQTLGDFYTTVD